MSRSIQTSMPASKAKALAKKIAAAVSAS